MSSIENNQVEQATQKAESTLRLSGSNFALTQAIRETLECVRLLNHEIEDLRAEIQKLRSEVESHPLYLPPTP